MIPIIGQPKIAEGWALTFTVVCPPPCGKLHLFTGQVGSGIACTSCRNTYMLSGFPDVTPEGLRIPMAMGRLPERT